MSENKKSKFARKFSAAMLALTLLFTTPLALAQDGGEEGGGEETLYEPVENQIVQLTDEGMLDEWNISRLETYGVKFLIRGKEALTWTLNIEDGGFHNPAIEQTYFKVLTIVNSLFILGLLAIAILWMFSTLVPRTYLKKIMLIYGLAVVFVNFALPINQLFIDGTNLLQQTLLMGEEGQIEIADIVQTPAYEDALSYRNEDPSTVVIEKEALTLDVEGETAVVPVGQISIAGETPETIALTSDPISIARDSRFSTFQEQTIFRFLMMSFTAIAYFIIALIFILRIVILWALLILSPVLLVLAIFKSTRGWFYNWLSMYGRWLLIGPLAALGIAIVVSIWKHSGLPIEVGEGYIPEVFSSVKDSNVVFYLPGKDTPNTLSNSQEMMEYVIFLLMLYLPIFMAFTLTKRKYLESTALAVSKTVVKGGGSSEITQSIATTESVETSSQSGFVENLKSLVTERVGFFSEKEASRNKLQVEGSKPTKMMEAAHNFLPDTLKQTPVPKMLELLGKEKGSKKSHRSVIERMARLEQLKDKKEREKVSNVLSEIQSRASEKDKEAMAILHEIQTIKEFDAAKAEGKEMGNVNIQINEEKPKEKKKVDPGVKKTHRRKRGTKKNNPKPKK